MRHISASESGRETRKERAEVRRQPNGELPATSLRLSAHQIQKSGRSNCLLKFAKTT